MGSKEEIVRKIEYIDKIICRLQDLRTSELQELEEIEAEEST